MTKHPYILTSSLPHILIALITALPAAAQQTLPQGVTRVASVEGITEYRLQNGLRALIMPDPSKGIRHHQWPAAAPLVTAVTSACNC